MNKILTILLAILITSCTAKKSTYEFKEHIKYDSINIQTEKIIYPTIKEVVYVDSPCDSLGKLKPFKQSYYTSQGKIIIEGKNNRITANIDLKGTSTTTIKDTNIHNDNVAEKKDEFKKVIVQDWRLIVILIISIVLNVYFFIPDIFKRIL
ncbi:hypothetical protein FNW52_12445 [Flavobacterium sp. ZT3R18]|uniref:hypothetical protein n=1 Tax=Flavobacterium sp. ZT3R18 TaxID=2594429 RepID=UPI001179BAE8|nr:hypothetical protein [Flavobacterium sp. ZT3R18]TRX34944.1 hypothetical protein FNW52_12445 [Flavobacterium sp. ZT3R18]